MNKLSKIFLVIILILAIALGVMIYYYFYWRNAYLSAANEMVNMVKVMQEHNITYPEEITR